MGLGAGNIHVEFDRGSITVESFMIFLISINLDSEINIILDQPVETNRRLN